MDKNILILTIGLPQSGKSTWAKTTGFPIVNLDAIRLALHGKPFIQASEPMVWTLALYMVKALFLAGYAKVVVDATNLTPKHRQRWESNEWWRSYKVFDTDKDECIRRAKKDGREDLIPVIERMAEEIDLKSIKEKG